MQQVKIKKSRRISFVFEPLVFEVRPLPSIASISYLTIVTAADGEAYGTKLVAKGGEIESQDPISTPVGTKITVEIYFITPQLVSSI